MCPACRHMSKRCLMHEKQLSMLNLQGVVHFPTLMQPCCCFPIPAKKGYLSELQLTWSCLLQPHKTEMLQQSHTSLILEQLLSCLLKSVWS